MRHETDIEPMTPEKAIKLKGIDLMMKLNNVGVPWDKCNLAALVIALELKQQFGKLFTGTEAERKQKLKQFEQLEEGIKGYLPMNKEQILTRFTEEIEKAFEEASSTQEFKEMVLNIIKSPKTKFKLFV